MTGECSSGALARLPSEFQTPLYIGGHASAGLSTHFVFLCWCLSPRPPPLLDPLPPCSGCNRVPDNVTDPTQYCIWTSPRALSAASGFRTT